MELGVRMLWTFLSGMGRRGGSWGRAFSSWQPRLPLAGLSSAREQVSHWTAVFEKRGIPEARESSEYIVAHVLGAKTVKCSIVKRVGGGRSLRKRPQASQSLGECWAERSGLLLKGCLR